MEVKRKPPQSIYVSKYVYPDDTSINNDNFISIMSGKYYEILKFIMSEKKLLNFKNGNDDTVLHIILNNKELSDMEKKDIVVKIVNLWGAPVDNKNKQGIRPIHLTKNLELIKFFISKKVNINSRDNNGLTPLHYAVMPEGKKCKNVSNNMLKNNKITDNLITNIIPDILNILKETKLNKYIRDIKTIFENDNSFENMDKNTDKDYTNLLLGDDVSLSINKKRMVYDEYNKILTQSTKEIDFKKNINSFNEDCKNELEKLEEEIFMKINDTKIKEGIEYIIKCEKIYEIIDNYKIYIGKDLDFIFNDSFNRENYLDNYEIIRTMLVDIEDKISNIKKAVEEIKEQPNIKDKIIKISDIAVIIIQIIVSMKNIDIYIMKFDEYNTELIKNCKEEPMLKIINEIDAKIKSNITLFNEKTKKNEGIFKIKNDEDVIQMQGTNTEYFKIDADNIILYKVTETNSIAIIKNIRNLYHTASKSIIPVFKKESEEHKNIDKVFTIFIENVKDNKDDWTQIENMLNDTKTGYINKLKSEKVPSKQNVFQNIINYIQSVLNCKTMKNNTDNSKRYIEYKYGIQVAEIDEKQICVIPKDVNIFFKIKSNQTKKISSLSDLEKGHKKITEIYTQLTNMYENYLELIKKFNAINGFKFIQLYLEDKKLINICPVNINLRNKLPNRIEEIDEKTLYDKYCCKTSENFFIITDNNVDNKDGIITSDKTVDNTIIGQIKEITSTDCEFKKEYTVINNNLDILLYYIKSKLINDFFKLEKAGNIKYLYDKIKELYDTNKDTMHTKIVGKKIDEIINATIKNIIKFKSSGINLQNIDVKELINSPEMSLVDNYYVQEIMDEYNINDKENISDNYVLDTDTTKFNDSLCFEINKDVVEELIKNGADVNASEKTGKTPLFFSSMIYNEDITELLKKKGAKISTSSYNIYNMSLENLKQLCLPLDFDSLNMRVIQEIEDKTQIDNMALKHSSSLILKMTYYLLMHQLTHNIYMLISIKDFEKIIGSQVKYDVLPLSKFTTDLDKENTYKKVKYDKMLVSLDEEITRVENSIKNLNADEQTDLVKELLQDLEVSKQNLNEKKNKLIKEFDNNKNTNKSETSNKNITSNSNTSRNICDLYNKFFDNHCSNKGDQKTSYTYYLDLWSKMVENDNNNDGTQLIKLINSHILEKGTKDLKQIQNIYEKVLNKYGRDYHELPFYLKSTNYALDQEYNILVHVFKHILSFNFINTIQYLIISQKNVNDKLPTEILNDSGFVKYCLNEMPQKIIKNVCKFSESDEEQMIKTDNILEDALKMLETYISNELLTFAQTKVRPFFNIYIETYVAEMHLLVVKQIKNCMNQYKIMKILNILDV